MTSYQTSGIASTASIKTMSVSMLAVAAALNFGQVQRSEEIASQRAYVPAGSRATPGTTSIVPSRGFAAEVTTFYQQLAAAQKPLGREFEAVLVSNLWDLYEA